MKKTLLAVALSLAGTSFAQSKSGGGISAKNVTPELRTIQITIDGKLHRVIDEDDINKNSVVPLTASSDGAAAAAALIPGTLGVVKVGVAATSVDFTTGFAPPPLPSKLKVYLVEDDDDSGLTCTGAVIYGFNQFGEPITESLGTISEVVSTEHSASNKTTSNVFEKVTRFTAACANADAQDVIVITGSHIIGLPIHISGVDAVKQVCYSRDTTKFTTGTDGNDTTLDNVCMIGGASDTAWSTSSPGLFDNAGTNNRIDVAHSSIDLSKVNSGLIATTGSIAASATTYTRATVYLRAPNGAK